MDLCDLVGNTPLISLKKFFAHVDVSAKLEFFNPGFSVKDRAALAMIEAAEESGFLKPQGIIVEPTSGNTGISLAWLCAVKNYKLILTMPEKMSTERWRVLKAYGAEIIFSPWEQGMAGAIAKAREIIERKPNAISLSQFDNQANPGAHFKTTGPELWQQMDGDIDFFVSGVGTGGTITGVGQFLKSKKSEVEIVAVEPFESAVLSGGSPGAHRIQGIGAGFVPNNFKREVVDQVVTVMYEEAIAAVQKLAKEEGILVGISSGANLAAIKKTFDNSAHANKRICTLLCDSGERYASLSFLGQ